MKGIVSRVESKDVYVLSDDKEIRCTVRGKLKLVTEIKEEKYLYKDIVIVGDIVEFSLDENNLGVIESIPERKNYISRKTPRIKGISEKGRRGEQILAANLDKAFCISSISEPEFNNRVIDRMLVIASSCNITPVIVINKTDFRKKKLLNYWTSLYTDLGYKVIQTSVVTGKGIEELLNDLKGATSLFWGHSGVGKTSLINSFDKNFNFKTAEISKAWNKGKHTTVTSILIKLSEDTYIIDSPGFREIEPYGLSKEQITHFFPEISDLLGKCRFNDCTHTHEPGCEVKEALEKEIISPERFYSYYRLIESIEKEKY